MQSQRTVRTDNKEANNILKKRKYLIRQCYIIDFTVQLFHLISFSSHFINHVSSHFLKSTLQCSCFILLSSVSPHFIDHVSFSFPSVHSPSHSFHLPSPSRSCLPYLVVFILHGHSTSLSVSLFSQSHLWKLTAYECL